MRLSSRADTLADAAPDPTATTPGLDAPTFDEERTIEDGAVEAIDVATEPPTAKVHVAFDEYSDSEIPRYPGKAWSA